MKRFFSFIALGALSLLPCQAVFPIVANTDSLGNFQGPNSWSGSGNVRASASATGGGSTFVTGFRSGTLTVGAAASAGADGLTQDGRMQVATGVSVEFTIRGGGTADLIINERGVSLTNLSGVVTGFTMKATFSNLMGVRGGAILPRDNNNAMGVGLLASGGTFQDQEQVKVTYGGARILSADGSTYTTTGGTYLAANETDNFVGDATGGTLTAVDGSQVVQTVDLDGDGQTGNPSDNGVLEEAERFYFRSVEMTVTAGTGTLTDNDANGGDTPTYRFTFDGRQHADSYAQANSATLVPEPSALALLLVTLGGGLLRRRRAH